MLPKGQVLVSQQHGGGGGAAFFHCPDIMSVSLASKDEFLPSESQLQLLQLTESDDSCKKSVTGAT